MPNANAYLRGIAPKATARDLDEMMWCCTPYPFSTSTLRRTRRALRKYFHLGGKCVQGAIAYAHDQLDYDFELHRQRGDPDRVVSGALPKIVPYSPLPPPSHIPTREYSRKLNRAIKFGDVAEFSRILSHPPLGMESGWWVDGIVHQLVSATLSRSKDHQDNVQAPMFASFLESGLPLPEGVFKAALENRNYPILRLLNAKGLTPPLTWEIRRAVVWQLLDGEWPDPQMWCPDILTVKLGIECFGRLFPSKTHPNPKGFSRSHVLRLATLPVGDDFKKELSEFYGALSEKPEFELLNTPHNQLVMATFMELGWLNEAVAMEKAKVEHRGALLGQLERVRLLKDHNELQNATPQTPNTRPIARL